MRFPKTALLAASVLVSSVLSAAQVNYTTSQYGQDITVNSGDTAILDATFSGSINRLLGDGNFVKNGTGVLQYKGFQAGDFYNALFPRYDFDGNSPPPTRPDSLLNSGALTGLLTVNQGELQVAGYLSQWVDWTNMQIRDDDPPPPATGMQGVSGVQLNGTSRLSFSNTPLNILSGADALFKTTTNHEITRTKRYNSVYNLKAGGIAGGAQTVLDTGLDKSYRIIVHIDDEDLDIRESGVGSIGILAGQGDLIKTGRDELTILGATERGFGRVVIGGGQVRLADSGGLAIATATSVNLVGSDGHRGGSLDGNRVSASSAWMPAFLPAPGSGSAPASLVLNNSQTIRNLQADFAFTVAPDPTVKTVENAILQSWNVKARDEAFTAGTGMGTFIDIGAHTLTINQDRDGIYRGSILGTGTIVANVASNHRLALILENPMEANLDIRSGIVVANANGLGSRTVRVDGGLEIYQDNAGTLNATLVGGGTVTLTSSLVLNNSLTGTDELNNMELNANGNRGTLAVANRQTGFTGTLRVLNGQTLELSSLANNALDAASSVTLEGTDPTVFATEGVPSTGGRIATLNIADGVQTLNNVQANAHSLIRLGRGSLTVRGASALNGSITGVGNLLFDGGNSLNGANANYTGATVVKSGTLTVNGNLANSSGLILAAGTRFDGSSADQTFGALFGGAGSEVAMGSRTLTIGATAKREALLQQQLAGQKILSTNYLGTQSLAPDISNASYQVMDLAPISHFHGVGENVLAGTVLQAGQKLPVGLILPSGTSLPGVSSSNYSIVSGGIRIDVESFLGADSVLPSTLSPSVGFSVINPAPVNDTDGLFNLVTSGIAAATRRYLLNVAGLDRATAESLAFAGSITGTGGLTKVGTDRLILTGVSTYTGATLVQGGTLQVNGDSLAGTSGVTVSAGATLAVSVGSGQSTFDRGLTGAGNFEKVGAGELTLAPGSVSYTGTTIVREGTLKVQIPAAMGAIDIFSGATFVATAGSTSPFAAALTGGAGGKFVKEGSDTLVLENTGGFFGDYEVAADAAGTNTLRIRSTPNGNMAIGAGGTLALALSGGSSGASTAVSGAGTLRIEGGLYTFTTGGNTTFTGTLAGVGTTITAGADDIFSAASVSLTGSTLDIGSTNQHFVSLTGDAGSTIAMSAGTLFFNPAAGPTATYAGKFDGTGNLVKNGEGTLSLTSTAVSTWVGAVTVNTGTLEATTQALGSASTSVFVDTNGTFAVRNDNLTAFDNYTQQVTGTGKLAKTGLGEVRIATIDVTGGVQVREGRLTVTAATDATVFNSVAVDAGATFQVNLPVGGLVHDSASANKITGAGNLAVSGPETLTLLGTQSYTGLTELLDGATLDVTGVTVLNGLAGAAGTVVNLPAALTLNQTSDGAFAGDFAGGGTLDVTGTGTFAYTGHNGDLGLTGVGAVSVSGGNLQVGVANTAAVALNNGTLIIDTTGAAAGVTYATAVTGTGAFVKTGTTDFDLVNATGLGGFTGTAGVSGGRLLVTPSTIGTNVTGFTTNGAGVLALNATATETLTRGVTGDGALEKVGGGLLRINSATLLGSTGAFTVREGTLGGTFRTGGDLIVNDGAHLAPGNSPGTVTVAGNFTNNGILDIELNATTSDTIVVGGTASVGGTIAFAQDNTPGSAAPLRGKVYTLVTAAGGVTLAAPGVTISQELLDRGIVRVALFTTGSTRLDAYVVTALTATPGYTPHEGLGELVSMFDAGTAPVFIQTRVDQASAAELQGLVNNLSPLGYASEYAMAQDGESHRLALLHERMNERRYDRGSPLTTEDAPWEAFAVGGAAFADNAVKTDTPTFDYSTFGGLVGLDKKLNDGLVVGAAIGYDNGSAKIHDNGGKVDLNRAAGTLFLSGQLTNRWYFDLGVSGGVGLYDSKRDTFAGRVKADNMGYSGGLNAETGTLIVLAKDLHLTPYVAAAYTHHEFEGFTESGAATALKVDSWSQDSLKAKIGTGLGWFVPLEWAKLKLGVDVAYSHELLDTESDLDARFVSGGGKFSTTAAALPQDAVSLSPSLGLQFDESLSATVGYSYEMGFDGRNYQSVNFSIRKRF